ncbi:MAG: hypothetical protein Q9203_002718 [Teloschistes exilis]
MASWRRDYVSALEARDRSEKGQKTLYDACRLRVSLFFTFIPVETSLEGAERECSQKKLESNSWLPDTKLADRTSTTGITHPRNITTPRTSSSPTHHNNNNTSPQPAEETLSETRRDLIEAQRSRALLQTRVEDASTSLQRLKLQSSVAKKRLEELTQEKVVLSQRLRDRDEELRGKAKLLEDVHDETVSLTLQLNMAEDRARKLRDENENLVKRWMERVGKEADAMNETSRFT